MRRFLGVVLTLAVALTALVLLGPARLRPWDCHAAVASTTPNRAATAYYDSCWTRPTVAGWQQPGRAPASQLTRGGVEWTDVQVLHVRYSDGRGRILLVGHRGRESGWTAITETRSVS